jgi:hypothetical protein
MYLTMTLGSVELEAAVDKPNIIEHKQVKPPQRTDEYIIYCIPDRILMVINSRVAYTKPNTLICGGLPK